MSLSSLISQIESLLPNESEHRVLQVATIIGSSSVVNMANSATPPRVSAEQVRLALSRLQSLDEQLAAAAHELDTLATTTPSEFEPSHVWTLIRTIKVQSQMLDLIYHQEQPHSAPI